MPPKPSWFRDGLLLVSNAPTCGINKDGVIQYAVDPATGVRSSTIIDDKLGQDVKSVVGGNLSKGYLYTHRLDDVVKTQVLVPQYYDTSTVEELRDLVARLGEDFTARSLGELQEEGLIEITSGHGSPSSDQRVGDVPYIKVSDLRAGTVNINPSNMVPRPLAEKFWKGKESGLEAYDLISPARASKNIGEFCVLLAGQEDIVLTREVFVLRTTDKAWFDQYYLIWAMSLERVRREWERVTLMQTNREDVGDRALEMLIPVPENTDSARQAANEVSSAFRDYYRGQERLLVEFRDRLEAEPHEFHVYL